MWKAYQNINSDKVGFARQNVPSPPLRKTGARPRADVVAIGRSPITGHLFRRSTNIRRENCSMLYGRQMRQRNRLRIRSESRRAQQLRRARHGVGVRNQLFHETVAIDCLNLAAPLSHDISAANPNNDETALVPHTLKEYLTCDSRIIAY